MREGKACKARSLEFQSTRKALRVINKMERKNSFIVEEARQFAVTMTRPEKDWERLYSCVVCEHALHQLSATHAWAGECVQASTAFTAALNILRNDLKV